MLDTHQPDTIMEIHDGKVYLDDRELFTGTIQAAVREIIRLTYEGGQHLVITPNVDQVLNLRDDPPFRRAYRSASLRLIDGMPLVWLARSLGAPGTIHRCTGADLLSATAQANHSKPLRIALVGGDPDISRDAAKALQHGNKHAILHSIEMPMLTDIADDGSTTVVDQINEFQPDICFIGMGSPKQELWFARWKGNLPNAVYIGSGAAVDFAAGAKTRAPQWIQRAGLEWAWRLSQEPTRLAHRYLVKGPRFVPFAVHSHRMMRKRVAT